jgi:hypothetical protein
MQYQAQVEVVVVEMVVLLVHNLVQMVLQIQVVEVAAQAGMVQELMQGEQVVQE